MSQYKIENEHTFHFSANAGRTKVLRSPVHPFNSGTWTWTYNSSTRTVSLECKGSTHSTPVVSVVLVSWVEYKPWPERHTTETGLNGTSFPPKANWKVATKVQLPSTPGVKPKGWIGTARLIVVLKEGEGAPAATFVSVDKTVPAAPVAPVKDDHRAALRAMAVMTSLKVQTAGDVALYFPASHDTLFVNAAALEAASPALKTLVQSPPAEFDSASSNASTESLFSSDDDDDSLYRAATGDATPLASAIPKPGGRPASSSSHSSTPELLGRSVITEYSFVDFHAVIVWLFSGYIPFGPIPVRTAVSAALATSTPTSQPTSSPSLSAPVPAAAIARVAASLGLDDLADLTLAKYKSQLTVQNVIGELIAHVPISESVKETVLAFASQHWTEVKQTTLAVELRKTGVVAGMPNGAEVGARLFEVASRC